MAINIITGQPRNGKSQRAMALILDKLVKENDELEKNYKPRRKIYIDIDGVNAPTTKTHIPDCITEFEQEKIWFGEHDDPKKPEDYWCPPYGSIFFFDECHKRKWVEDTSGSLSKNPTTISLNEHGHAGHDIYLLTQFPQYIHTHIRGLVQEHWHVKRIVGLRRAFVYKWDEFIANPRAKTNMEAVYEKETFKFKRKYEEAYKSASAHAKIKFKFPKQMLWVIIALAVIVVLLINSFSKSMFARKLDKEKQEQEKQQTEQQIDQLQEHTIKQNEKIEQLENEIKELKDKYLPRHIVQLAEHEDIRPAMVISNAKECQAFNKYGEPLVLPDELCWQMDEYPSLIPRSRQIKNTNYNTQNQPYSNIQESNINYIDTKNLK